MSEALRVWTQGAIAMGYAVVAFYFIRYWRETHEPLFVFFTAGFFVLAVHRTLFAITDEVVLTFSLRLLGYLLILAGIVSQRFRHGSTPHQSST